jgi:hypothetical protein
MTRREFLPFALLALPEIAVPTSADERLTQAVDVWVQATATLADQRAAYEATTRQLASARSVPAHRLRTLVETRRAALLEVKAAERAVEDAEATMEQAARLVGGE